jgi:short-subunit dehydrogenase
VLAVCPEGVRTDLLKAASRDGGIGALAARAVRAAGPVLEPEDVADAIVAALGRDELLVLPHADVARWTELRARDNARWIRVMSGLQQRLEDDALG